jgi:1,2-diacylglycerol 3-alpha-glucosyltransferase
MAEMGTKSILFEGQGALIAPQDEKVFAGRVLELLNNPEYRHALGEKAHGYARHWSAYHMAERMMQFYRKVIAGR